MLQHRRTPAVAILLAVLLAGGALLLWIPAPGAAAGERIPARADGARTLAELEIAIASERATAADWYAYADELWARRQFRDTALACRKVLELEPYHREARFRGGLALAAAGQVEAFHEYLRELTWSDAKLAVDLFGRAESRPYLAEPRFQALLREAQNQAMD